jgi:hypothetical protein
MLRDRNHFLLWKRQVFVRNPNDELNALFSGHFRTSGIYLIGCANDIVYIGQSWNLLQRPFESLGLVYHQVHDTSLAWSMAIAPCPPEEMDELESAAIRAYAPKFNTSIPSISKREGRMPVITRMAQVFADQKSDCMAFHTENVRRQIQRASSIDAPPWRKGKKIELSENASLPEQIFDIEPIDQSDERPFRLLTSRSKKRIFRIKQRPNRIKTYFEHRGAEIHIDEVYSEANEERSLTFEWLAKSYEKEIGTGTEIDKSTAATRAMQVCDEFLDQPYRFKINLCDDGSVVTRDGEYLGIWKVDENDHPSFIPDGSTEVLFFEMWIGLLCEKIVAWHEGKPDQTKP